MPIYEQVYKSRQGMTAATVPAWWIIGRTGIRLSWKKSMVLLLLVSSIPLLFRAVQVYMATKLDVAVDLTGEAGAPLIDAGYFLGFIGGQMFLLIMAMILAGAGLVVNDRKFKALPLYFSKPLDFRDYVSGKFMVIYFYGSLLTLIPSMLLFLIMVLTSRDLAFLKSCYWVPFALIIFTSVILVTMGAVILAVSSAARGARSASIFFFVAMTIPDLFRRVIPGVPGIGLFSITADLQQVGAFVFKRELPFEFPAYWSAGVLAAVIIISYVVIRKRVKPEEVVT